MLPVRANVPPSVSTSIAPVAVTGPEMVNPPALSLRDNAPPVVVVPTVPNVLVALVNVNVLPVFAVNVLALIAVPAFCVTAPLMLSTPASPRTKVPLPTEILPTAAVVASLIVIADAPAFVVVNVPDILTAPSLESTVIDRKSTRLNSSHSQI